VEVEDWEQVFLGDYLGIQDKQEGPSKIQDCTSTPHQYLVSHDRMVQPPPEPEFESKF